MNQRNDQINNLVHTVDAKISPLFTEKLPSLPANIREFIATITPYLTMLFVFLGGFALLALLGLTTVASPFVMMFNSTGSAHLAAGFIGILFLAGQVVLEGLAIPGLLKRQKSAWNLLFLAALVSLIFDLISLNLFGLVINFLITFYLLYQIKPYYNK